MSSARLVASLSFAALGALASLPACDDEVVTTEADAGVLVVACDSKSCECPEGKTCKMTCKAGESCDAKCQKGSSCDVDCAQSTACTARCFDEAKGTIRRKDGDAPTVTSTPTGDCKVCLGECNK